MCRIFGTVFMVVLVLPCYSAGLEPDSIIVRKVVSYFEGSYDQKAAKRDFAAFDLFGTTSYEETTRAYGVLERLSFEMLHDQVYGRGGTSSPVSVILVERNTGLWVAEHERPQAGADFRASVGALFPAEYLEPALKSQLSDSVRELAEARIADYYASRLPVDRFTWKARPANATDPHGHPGDIYGTLNLKSTLDYIRVVPDPPGVVHLDQQPDSERKASAVSPRADYTAWTSTAPYHRLLFQESLTRRVFEVVNPMPGTMQGIAWKYPTTLVFDQVNGTLHGKPFGVHIELDVNTQEVIWAAPFGPLGFPKHSLRE